MEKNIADYSDLAACRRATGQKYRPKYHAAVPVGWSNDPNGIIYAKGFYHLFYQYNPYSTHWETMHWGHMISKDMVHWEDAPIALVPGDSYDNVGGCFSGTAIEKDGELVLMYTGVDEKYQQQCLAFSKDGLVFEKYAGNPVISYEETPKGYTAVDFRDPKVFEKDGTYYCLIGTRKDAYGNIALYTSKDLIHWSVVGMLFEPDVPESSSYYRQRGTCECPDYQVIDGREVLLISAQDLDPQGNKFENGQTCVVMIGKLNFETGRFVIESIDEVDGGQDFYAPEMLKTPDGRTVMIGWKEMWHRSFPSREDGWAGSYTFPRELNVKDHTLVQQPVSELKAFLKDPITVQNIALEDGKEIEVDGIGGNVLMLDVKIALGKAKKAGVKLFAGEGEETVLVYDTQAKTLTMDRTNSGVTITGPDMHPEVRINDLDVKDGVLDLKILLDVTCIEVFAQGGISCMSTNVYAKNTGIRFFAEGEGAVLTQALQQNIEL